MSTKLHLGLVSPSMAPGVEVQRDALLVMAVGFPVYVFNGLGAQLVATLLSQASPGLWQMLVVSLLGGALTMLFMMALAYYGTIAAWRVDIDPDSVGIPVVTASVDFVGVVALIAVAVTIGVV
jgi:mgtE-like transporter